MSAPISYMGNWSLKKEDYDTKGAGLSIYHLYIQTMFKYFPMNLGTRHDPQVQ
jgi:hypothetical protein